MMMARLAFRNVKGSFRHYLVLILSQAFTVMILFNFQILLYSGSFDVLGTRNREYIQLLIQMVSFVLGCFMFFFIWYSTNVFLTKRKREIGIYVFMGLSNERIGQMYLIEAVLIGAAAWVLGLGFGTLGTGLFQMILLKLSDLAVEIQFRPKLRPVLTTTLVYFLIYLVFMVKGYMDIARSSVLSLISASKKMEAVGQSQGWMMVKAVFGIALLGTGYYLACKQSHSGVMGNAFLAVVLVTAGVYLLFGGMIPALFQAAAGNKRFLYQRQRVLWMNSFLFRMRGNYRTYAIVCVLMLCSVTAIATSFALKGRYENIIQFENTYTFQLLSSRDDLDGQARALIEEDSEIQFDAQIPMLYLDESVIKADSYYSRYGILPYSQVEQLAARTGLEFPFEGLAEDEVIRMSHLYLMSMITAREDVEISIGQKTYRQIEDTSIPYLGYLQESACYYIVNDQIYEKLRDLGEEVYVYNYRVKDTENFGKTREKLDQLVSDTEENKTARIAIDPDSNELDWIKVLYSICIFMFQVFVLAGGSIMFMKLYHDAFEEKERFQVILKLGFDQSLLKRSVAAELGAAYGLTFFVMAFSSIFSVKALGNMMFTDLTMVNLVSVGVVFVILLFWYLLSVQVYGRNSGLS